MKNVSAFKLVKETAEVSETSTNLEEALKTLIAAAHGREAKNVNDATKLVERLLLKDNSFACFVVGNCRNKDGYIMDLVGNTIRAFEKAGLKLYNDIILRNAYGTAMLRANTFMRYKKVVKVHQNILVFCKGNPKKFID